MAAIATAVTPPKPPPRRPVKVAPAVDAVPPPPKPVAPLDAPGRPRSNAVIAPVKPVAPSEPVKGANGKKMTVARGANGKVTLVAPPPQVEVLTLSGGGGKGAAMPGAVRALERSGVMKDVKLITGASVGSMTAAMVAAGATADEFAAIANDPKIASTIKEGKNMAEVIFGGGLDGDGLEGLVRAKMCGSMGKRIIEYIQAETAANRKPDAGVLAIAKKIADGQHGPTFGDLRVLSKVIPAIKEVSVSVSFMGQVDPKTGKMTKGQPQTMMFNADTEPDMEVALAVQASAALPPVFKPVDIPLSSGITARFQDGGVLNNAPTPDSTGAEREVDPVPDSRGMTFVFESDESKAALTGDAVPHKDCIADYLTGAEHSAATYGQYRGLADHPEDVVMLPLSFDMPPPKKGGKGEHKDFTGFLSGTVNFDMDLPDKLKLQDLADEATTAQIQKRQQPQAREFDSVEQMLICIPRADLAAMALDGFDGAAGALKFRDEVTAIVAQLTQRVQALASQPARTWPQDAEVAAALATLEQMSKGNTDRQGFVARELNRSGKLDGLLQAARQCGADDDSDVLEISLGVNDALLARAHAKAVLRDVIYPKMVRTDPKGVSGLLLDQVDDRLRAADSPQAVNDALRMLINYYRAKSDPLGVWGHKAFTNQLQACLMKLST
ncbi:MAG: patatin-like phospholipase family protein [Aquabacterium sp.]